MPTLCLQGLRLLALGLLALGLASPWFVLPVAGRGGEIVGWQPLAAIVFKAAVVLALGAAAAITFRSLLTRPGGAVPAARLRLMSRRGPFVITAATLAGLLLGFPYTVMVLTPSAGARATELASEHDTLTWLGGDIYNAQEYEAVAAKGAEIFKSAPRAIEITPAPLTLSGALAIANLDELAELAGFTPAFAQFVKRGWPLTVGGLLLLALSLLRTGAFALRRKGDYGIARRAGTGFAIASACVLAAVVGPSHFAASALDLARAASAEGDRPRAIRALDSARRWMPSLAYHTDLIHPRGGLEGSGPHRQLREAIELEKAGFEARAERAYGALLANGADTPPPVSAEARRALLRFATHDLNSGQTARAGHTLAALHAGDPCGPRLNYALQIVALRLGRDGALAERAAELEELYAYFQAPEKRAAIAASQRHLSLAALDRGDAVAAAHHNTKSRRP